MTGPVDPGLDNLIVTNEEGDWRKWMYALEGDELIFMMEYAKTRDAGKAYILMKEIDEGNSPKYKRAGIAFLSSNALLSAIVKNMISDAAEEAEITYVGHLQELNRIKDIALDMGKVGVALQAEIARGRAAGIYVERKSLTIDNIGEKSTAELHEMLLAAEKKDTKNKFIEHKPEGNYE